MRRVALALIVYVAVLGGGVSAAPVKRETVAKKLVNEKDQWPSCDDIEHLLRLLLSHDNARAALLELGFSLTAKEGELLNTRFLAACHGVVAQSGAPVSSDRLARLEQQVKVLELQLRSEGVMNVAQHAKPKADTGHVKKELEDMLRQLRPALRP